MSKYDDPLYRNWIAKRAKDSMFDELFYKAMVAAKLAGKREPIIGPGGEVTGTSRNLAGIIRAIGRGIVKFVEIVPSPEGEKLGITRFRYGALKENRPSRAGILRVRFEDGRRYETDFGSYEVLKMFVKNRRNLHGVPLFVSGKRHGEVSSKNPALTPR